MSLTVESLQGAGITGKSKARTVYLFFHLVIHVTLDTSVSVYNFYITKHNL